jgi:enamine deaminase RidA (YjgF/YER057c/UK114 family)
MDQQRHRVSSGSPYEPVVGFSRGIRVGNRVEIAGTASYRDGEVVGEGDVYAQTVRCLEIIREALVELGARLEDVVRTRIYVTDISQWKIVGRAHGEVFANIRPVSAMVEVKALIDPRLLVEIEAEAVIGAGDSAH